VYRVGARTKSCGSPACISRDVNISPSTVTLNVLLERNELIRWIMAAGKCHLESSYDRPGCHAVSEDFSISKKTAAVDTPLLVVRKPHTLKYRAVACIKPN